MPEEKTASLPKPLTDLPRPEKELPLPEKELTSGKQQHNNSQNTDLASQDHPLRGSTVNDKPKSSFILKSFLLGIFFVILIVAIGGGSFIMGHKTKSENNQTVTTQVSSPTPAPAWKTYSGDGFSFQYPSFLALKESEEKKSYITQLDSKKVEVKKYEILSDHSTPAEDNLSFSVSVADNPNNLTPTQFLTSYKNLLLKLSAETDEPSLTGCYQMTRGTIDRLDSSLKDFNVGEISGKYFILGHAHNTEHVLMSKNNKIYRFTFHNAEGDPVEGKAKEYLDQILSPFTYTDENKDKTRRIIIQDDYHFDTLIPANYSFLPSDKKTTSYIGYIVDKNGEKLIGFGVWSGGGESIPGRNVNIDGIPFVTEYADINDDYKCGTVYDAPEIMYPVTENRLNFFVYTWCGENENDNTLNKKVIPSLKFSSKLKEVFLKRTPPPVFK